MNENTVHQNSWHLPQNQIDTKITTKTKHAQFSAKLFLKG